MSRIDESIKAVVGGLIAGLGAIQTALSDGHITSQEYVTSAVAFVAALGLVYAVPNAARTADTPATAGSASTPTVTYRASGTGVSQDTAG